MVYLMCHRSRILVSFQNPLEFEYVDANPMLNTILTKLTKWLVKKPHVAKIFKGKVPAFLKEDKQTFLLPNGVNTDHFRPRSKIEAKKKLGLDIEKKYILFVSAKNIERKQKRYDIFKAMLDELKKNKNFKNYDALTLVNEKRENVPYYFNASEVHVITSDFEGSPNSVKESLSSNIPVVARDVGNIREMIAGAKNCFISNSANPKELANLVQESVDTNSDLRRLIFENGLDLQTTAVKLLEIYKNIIGIK
jgi:glycosyltransferase involved in cell wall biosynthesis